MKISDTLFANRINEVGKITDLTSDFTLRNQEAFSLYIHPKKDTDDIIIPVKVRPLRNEDYLDCPFTLDDWNSISVVSIKANAIDLTNYDVWWGAGDTIKD